MVIGVIAVLLTVAIVVIGLASFITFIVGLVSQRKPLWITGIVGGVVSIGMMGAVIVSLVVMGVHGFNRAARSNAARNSARARQVRGQADSRPIRMSSSKARDQFAKATGIRLDRKVHFKGSVSTIRDGQEFHYLCFRAPKDFSLQLEVHFQPGKWDEVSKHLEPKQSSLPFWSRHRIRQSQWFTKTHADADGTQYNSWLAYDQAGNRDVWFVTQGTKKRR